MARKKLSKQQLKIQKKNQQNQESSEASSSSCAFTADDANNTQKETLRSRADRWVLTQLDQGRLATVYKRHNSAPCIPYRQLAQDYGEFLLEDDGSTPMCIVHPMYYMHYYRTKNPRNPPPVMRGMAPGYFPAWMPFEVPTLSTSTEPQQKDNNNNNNG
eukprot:PhM_4_TR8471/c0_g1_i1/m.89848